jgi:hypothetical protein
MRIIESKGELAVFINTPNCTQPTRLFCCNKVELVGNHLFFYSQETLLLKVWLKDELVRIDDALVRVGISVNDFGEKLG